jgi:hypothetical protein
MSLGLHAPTGCDARRLAAWSRAALDRPLARDAELTVAAPLDTARVRGSFQRSAGAHAPSLRRGSGGPTVLVGPGTLWVTLALAHPSALVPCPPGKLVNRYVRPLLRALSADVAPAHYLGRDFITVAKRPAAWIGFAHDATSGRAAVEAIVAVRAPFAVGERAAFRGGAPATLDEIAGRPIEVAALGQRLLASFGDGAPVDVADPPSGGAEDGDDGAPPWEASVLEAIGDVSAGRDAAGRLRVGGELMASRDALAAVERAIADAGPHIDEGEVERIVDAAFARPGVVIEGVRSLRSLRDAIVRALQKRA